MEFSINGFKILRVALDTKDKEKISLLISLLLSLLLSLLISLLLSLLLDLERAVGISFRIMA
jgi:hypothetical protein